MFTSGFDSSKPARVTLAGAPTGHDVRVLAELASRVQGKPLLFVALDDVRAALVSDALAFFAPLCEFVSFPAWDCLPYDRISPHPDVVGDRVAALARLAKPFKQPCIVITTVNAMVQRTLPAEALQGASLNAAIGDTLPVEKLREYLAANGFVNAGTVREPGEFAVRGGIVDLFPPGYEQPIRIDYFGDDIESIRMFDALSQTTTEKIERFHLGPISEVLLDERTIAHFRSKYRELFGAVNDSDPLYESVTASRKFPGVEHWLGLFYPHTATLFDYMPGATTVFDYQADEAITSRLQQIDDFYQARLGLYQASKRAKMKEQAGAVYKPAPVASLYLDKAGIEKALASRAVADITPFLAPETLPPGGGGSEKSALRSNALVSAGEGVEEAPSPAKTKDLLKQAQVFASSPARGEDIINAHGQRGRDFADARAKGQDTDLYTSLQTYIGEQQAAQRRVAIACYSQGSAERLSGIMRQHGFNVFSGDMRGTVPLPLAGGGMTRMRHGGGQGVSHLEQHPEGKQPPRPPSVPPASGREAPTAPSIPSAIYARNWDELKKCDAKAVAMVILGFEHGFVAPDLAVITEQDILGDRLVRPARKRRNAKPFQLELGSLNPGDFVVHAEHGIGRYEGLETLNVLNTAHDCVKLIYDGGDKLYVPVENLDVLNRYATAETGAVLDKLGGVGWQTRKARVKKRLKDMAEELMRIAAARELRKGEVIDVPQGSYQEFAARFPYAETEDQANAIQSVLDDLASGRPMDRLVCGDVGFGKTEVALRAAFAAVQAGLQVAVVVPTTLLARQHFNNFSNRFSTFPVRVAQLSRMVTAADAAKTKEDMKAGRIDIVVGTHALLGKDVGFANLGLMIIDEEQHFGVKQKERLKDMRAEVHVLTLTATPIPRTLQLAMSGVRELSLIATPPLDRLAVRTFVLPYDPLVIREAIMREHYRGGQCYYVCPRIEDLTSVAEELRQLVPEIKMVTAHGRLTPTQLDDIMTAFDARQYDLLLATNIVESGLDIPNANTIILHRADMFGLAQLYQLRGRVGRAKLRGYAYLTYAAGAMLAPTAQQRLEVIQTLDQLGAGFQLASHDMDIRGAGNLLGEEQSGHIREVGLELYQQMLADAVATARAGGAETANQNERWTPQINLGMSVLIPENYVTDLNVRLGLYRRLADIAADDEIEPIAAEMIDRFGALPPEVENLLQTVAVKQLCRKAGIDKIDAGPKGAVISFRNNSFARPDKLVAWIGQQAGTVKARPDQKIILMRAWDEAQQRLDGMKKTLSELAFLAA